MANANDQLKQQIEADPRVVELARSRQRGSQPGVASAAELRELGYPMNRVNRRSENSYSGHLNGGICRRSLAIATPAVAGVPSRNTALACLT